MVAMVRVLMLSKKPSAWFLELWFPDPVTAVSSLAVLFSEFGSAWSADTLASSVIEVSVVLVGAFTTTVSGSAVLPGSSVGP